MLNEDDMKELGLTLDQKELVKAAQENVQAALDHFDSFKM